jgi:hypothetical protein
MVRQHTNIGFLKFRRENDFDKKVIIINELVIKGWDCLKKIAKTLPQ